MKAKHKIRLLSKILIALVCVLCISGAMSGSSDRDYAVERLGTLYDLIEMYYYKDVDPEELYRKAAKGMLEAVEDRYTRYVVKDTLDDTSTNDTTEGNFGGVGTVIQKIGDQAAKAKSDKATNANKANGGNKTNEGNQANEAAAKLTDEERWVLIAEVIKGSPAERAGLKRGDFITKIDGIDTRDLTLKQIMDMMRGTINTDVVFDILRQRRPMQVRVTRGLITVPTVRHAYFPNERMGYIAISSFTPYTPRDTEKALRLLTKEGATQIMLDLRGNPGGAFQAAQQTADLFIDKGYIVHSQGKSPFFNETVVAKKRTAIPMNMPLYVLIDSHSASASEVLSGALQDHKRATILGRTSFGKGVVQAVLPFYGDQVLITSAEYLTPNKNHIHGIGVVPEQRLPLTTLNKEQTADLKKLLESREIFRFVAKNYPLSSQAIQNYVQSLTPKYPNLSADDIERQVRIDMNKFQDADIFANPKWDYDIKHALDYILYGITPEISEEAELAEQEAKEASKATHEVEEE